MIVDSIEDYIKVVKEIVSNRKTKKQIVVYRGEKEDYGETAFVPNIFRDKNYKDNEAYESNLYHELYSSGIVTRQSLLQTAIDAQHGGFPSRLLDVTYNSLVALYFATENAGKDKKDEDRTNAKVAIFFIDDIYTPGSFKSEELFESVINANSFYRKVNICAKNHKLIDHMNKNDRIKAQQGAFILFQGQSFENIPRYVYEVIEINKSKVNEISKELGSLFGMTVGRIYPEPSNQINFITDKMKLVYNGDNSIKNEFILAIDNFMKIIDFEISNLDRPETLSNSTSDNIFLMHIDDLETKILHFKQDIIESINQVETLHLDGILFNEINEEISNYYNFNIKIINEKMHVLVVKINRLFSSETLNLELSPLIEFLIQKEESK